jgi:hypothetical protein
MSKSSPSNFAAEYTVQDGKVMVDLTVCIWEENGITYVYSPALDMTGYGNSKKEAKKSFEIMFREFVDYTDKKRTLFDELEHLGWTVNRKKKRMHAPDIKDLLDDNKTFREIHQRADVDRQMLKLAV